MIKGRFHCWYWSKSKHGKNILLAVVERADGKIKTYLAFEFYFTDNEYWNETESALGAEEIIFPRVEEKQKPTSKKK